MKELIPEIEELAYWMNDYAETLPEENRIKMSDAACYLHLLKALASICPDEILNKVQL